MMTRATVLSGLGTSLPDNVVTNAMLAEELDTSDSWIFSRTGIQTRHVVEANVTSGDLAVKAAAQALSSAGVKQIEAVILATATPDFACPATAPQIAARLGLTGALAFDISAVCSGFIYGLSVASGLITSGIVNNALLIGADIFSQTLDPKDRTTRAIFGDGAGAVVLRAGDISEPGALLAFDLGSDGTQAELLFTPNMPRLAKENVSESFYFHMNGKAVFSQAVMHMTHSVKRVIEKPGWSTSDIHRLVPHQANTRILAAVADQLDVEFDRVVSNISEVGNTVAASIPLALSHGVQHGQLHAGENVVLTGFGAGLTWGSVALRWPDIRNSPG